MIHRLIDPANPASPRPAGAVDHGSSRHLVERAVTPAEAGRPAGDLQATVIAVLRADQLFLVDQPEAAHLTPGDRMLLLGAGHPRPQDHQWTESQEGAGADCLV